MEGILTQEERKELVLEVALFIAGNPIKLTSIIPEQHFIRIRADTVPATYAFFIIRYCETSAWVENPALIIQLLDKFKYLPVFDQAINRIKSGTPHKFHLDARPWDTVLLALDLPFLNRQLTRKTLEAFLFPLQPTLDPPGIRVLVVKGPSKSGKSFTYDYIRYINSFLTALNFRIVWLDLKKQASSRFGPLDLTRALLSQINPDWVNQLVLPELDEQQQISTRDIMQLCTIIAEEVALETTPCFIILDSLDASQTTEVRVDSFRIAADTQEMILRLAAICTGSELSDVSNDTMRLVLLGLRSPVVNFRNRVRVDDIQAISADDIRQYFIDYAKYRQVTLDPTGLEDMVQVVLNGEDISDPDRTQHLAHKALNIAELVIS